ncbi:MAG TPA: hypothetical protein VGR81_01325 [Candidatus Acidoferrales bacterium]|nr:hypothetical protein [Candidatus Acidoferrales bacterium]
MNAKKALGAIVVAYLVRIGLQYFVYSVLMRPEFAASADVWRSQDDLMHRMWIMLLAQFIFTVGAVLIYQRGIEKKPWLGQGIRFGILLSFVSAFPFAMSQYVAVPIHHRVALHEIIAETCISILMGLVIAAICKKETSTN